MIRVRIRTKILLMFALVLAVLLGIGFYATDAQKNIRDKAITGLKDSARIVEYSRLAQLHFLKQVEEWKNILLRGHDPDEYEKYLAQFREEVRNTRAVIETLRQLVVDHPATERLVEEFSEQHIRLGKEYNEALKVFDRSLTVPHISADRYVMDIDRKPAKLLDVVVELTLQDRDAKLASIETNTASLERQIQVMVLIAAAGSILLLLVLVDRLVGRPMEAATEIANRIAKGDLTGPTEVRGSAEAHLLLETLKNMQTSLAETMESLERERNLFVSGPTVVFKWDLLDGWPVIYVSPNVTEQFGYSPDELVRNKRRYLELIHPDDRVRVLAEVNAYLQAHTPVFEQEYRLINTRGEYRWLFDLTVVQRDGAGEIEHLHGYVIDITRTKQADSLEQKAYHDSLTGLPNRRLLEDHLGQALSYAVRHKCYGAIFYLDLDYFKSINDSLGHQFGDELLKEVAARLTRSIRHEDTPARLGGDEFVILLPQLDGDYAVVMEQAQGVAEKIRKALSCPYEIEGHELNVTSSIGVTLFSGDQAGVEDILKQADAAMYAAKKAGRNTIKSL